MSEPGTGTAPPQVDPDGPVWTAELEINPRPAVAEEAPSGARRSERSRRARRALGSALVPTSLVLALLVIWEVASRSGWQPDYILPPPTDVAADLWKDRASYWENTRVTLEEVLIGFGLGLVFGLVVGAVIALVPTLRRAFYPLVVASQSLPTLALAPLLVLWFGFGIVPKVLIVIQVVFFPIAVSTISGFASVSSESLVFGRSLGASGWMLLRKVRIPASLPYVFNGLKVSASYAAIAAVIAEWAGSEKGLGAMMLRANDSLATEAVFGALVLITVIGVGAFALVSLLERLLVPWHERYRRRPDQ